jgi:circadian clock protein KaiB
LRQLNGMELILYIAGRSLRSLDAVTMVEELCEACLKERYRLEVVDIREHTERAVSDQIIAIPTIVRKWPLHEKILIGASSPEKISLGLEIER